ncbi:MAG: hypothetical protein ACK4K7_08260 [Allosphingosinicella sp.]|uniref:hypothetical protein n=1 Tax=Allosphingosinicella sp. TaxID=2823234 RepID=UPI003960CAF9
MSGARVFNPRLIAGIVAAGIAAFGALLLVLAFADELRPGGDGRRAHALSVSALGFQGLVRLVGHDGATMTGFIRNRAEHATAEGLLVAVIEPMSRGDVVADLIADRDGLPTLFILPKWAAMPDELRPSWVQGVAPSFGPAAEQILSEDFSVEVEEESQTRGRAVGEGALEGLSAPLPRRTQTISGPRLEPLLTTDDGRILLAAISDQPLYILAEPDLFNNHGIADPARAAMAVEILDRLRGEESPAVWFDLVVNGFESARNPLRLAFEPPFLALTLAAFVAALLAGLHGWFRFGPEAKEARAIAFGKAALVENTAGLIRFVGREHHIGGAYADLVRLEAARATGAPATLRGDALDAYFNRLTPRHLPSFTEMVHRLHAAGNRHELLAAAQALHDWKKEITK